MYKLYERMPQKAAELKQALESFANEVKDLPKKSGTFAQSVFTRKAAGNVFWVAYHFTENLPYKRLLDKAK